MYLINSTQLPKILFVPCQEHFCKHFLTSKSALVLYSTKQLKLHYTLSQEPFFI